MDSFQFNEAFLVLRAPNWTSIHWSPWLAGSSAAHIPLTAYWDPQSCSSTRHPQPGALQRAQPPSDLTHLPALLQHSCWKVN